MFRLSRPNWVCFLKNVEKLLDRCFDLTALVVCFDFLNKISVCFQFLDKISVFTKEI